MRRPAIPGAPGAPSVLAAHMTGCPVVRAEAHGVIPTDDSYETVKVGIECDPEGQAGGGATYELWISGMVCTSTDTLSAGSGADEGAIIQFVHSDAIRAVHELLGRAIVTAERHGVLPSVPAPKVPAPSARPTAPSEPEPDPTVYRVARAVRAHGLAAGDEVVVLDTGHVYLTHSLGAGTHLENWIARGVLVPVGSNSPERPAAHPPLPAVDVSIDPPEDDDDRYAAEIDGADIASALTIGAGGGATLYAPSLDALEAAGRALIAAARRARAEGGTD